MVELLLVELCRGGATTCGVCRGGATTCGVCRDGATICGVVSWWSYY